MKVKDIIKKQTTVIAIAVIMIVITAIGVSYAIFFDVKTNSNNQVITAGSLRLTLTNAEALSLTEPSDEVSGLASEAFNYTVQNTDSNLPATYKIYIYADNTNTVDLNTVNISVDGSTSSKLTSLTSSSCTQDNQTYTCYSLDSGELAAGASATTKYVRVWVDEDQTGKIENKELSLFLHITSEVDE